MDALVQIFVALGAVNQHRYVILCIPTNKAHLGFFWLPVKQWEMRGKNCTFWQWKPCNTIHSKPWHPAQPQQHSDFCSGHVGATETPLLCTSTAKPRSSLTSFGSQREGLGFAATADQLLSHTNTKLWFAELQQFNCKFELLSSKDYSIWG